MKFKIIVLWLVLISVPASLIFAEETATFGDYMYGIGTKFGRGLENVVTSLAEIPCTVRRDMKEQGGSGFFPGLGMGTVYMLRRMLVGVTEVGTFFIPMERTIPRVCQETKPSVT